MRLDPDEFMEELADRYRTVRNNRSNRYGEQRRLIRFSASGNAPSTTWRVRLQLTVQ